jgi:hypothetical protein
MERMAIIRKYQTDPNIAADHDVIYCGDFGIIEQMTETERIMMEAWGWKKGDDGWLHPV